MLAKRERVDEGSGSKCGRHNLAGAMLEAPRPPSSESIDHGSGRITEYRLVHECDLGLRGQAGALDGHSHIRMLRVVAGDD